MSSRDFSALGNLNQDQPLSRSGESPVVRPGEYSELLSRLFQRPSAVAVTACGANVLQAGICEGIAAELSAAGHQVVVVPVDRLLLTNPVRVIDEISLLPGVSPNVWVWPSISQQLEAFSSQSVVDGENWLQRLRRTFHTVILDCPSLEEMPEVSEISAMADATLLVVEANRTTRQQIQKDQFTLQIKGAHIAGCLLVRGR